MRLSQREALVFGVPGAEGSNSPDQPPNTNREIIQFPRADDGVTAEPLLRHLQVERTMIWTQLEACQRQVTQVGASACGATAVINALIALEVPHTLEGVLAAVKTRLRANAAPLPERPGVHRAPVGSPAP